MKKFSINFFAIILWIWLFLVNGFVVATNYLLAIFLHEIGHFFVAKKLGYQLVQFSVSPYGFMLDYSGQRIEKKDEILIALAGPLANFCSAFFVLGLWWLAPEIYAVSSSFVLISFALGAFNLIPAYPLDGGKIFCNLIVNLMNEKKSKCVTKIVNFVFATTFFVSFLISCFVNFNPTFLLFSCFLFAGILEIGRNSKYKKIDIFNKKLRKFEKFEFCYVSNETTLKDLSKKMQRNKNFVFVYILENGKTALLSEQFVVKIMMKYDFNCTLQEILGAR